MLKYTKRHVPHVFKSWIYSTYLKV
jgi:hypothetical protein